MAEKLTLSVLEASQLLGISKGLCYQLCREGKLPGTIRLGAKRIIISRLRLEAWLSGEREASSAP